MPKDRQSRGIFSSLFPHPVVSCIVGLSWIMLQHSASVGNLLLALVLGWGIPKLMQNFIDPTPNIRWGESVKLFFVVLWDIIVSNFKVAKLVLGPTQSLHPKWFRVPLATNHQQVNTLLAMIITTTPGTVSAGIDQERGDILVHSLNTIDEHVDIEDIKLRYEQALMRIFDVDTNTDYEEEDT